MYSSVISIFSPQCQNMVGNSQNKCWVYSFYFSANVSLISTNEIFFVSNPFCQFRYEKYLQLALISLIWLCGALWSNEVSHRTRDIIALGSRAWWIQICDSIMLLCTHTHVTHVPLGSHDWVLWNQRQTVVCIQELEPKTFHKFNLMLEISQWKRFIMKFLSQLWIFSK